MKEISNLGSHQIQLKQIAAKRLMAELVEVERSQIKIKMKNWCELTSETEAEANVQIILKNAKDETFLDIIYFGKCEAQPGTDKEQLRHFAEVQSITLLWPYLREAISTIMTKMGLPPLFLPTLDVAIAHQKLSRGE